MRRCREAFLLHIYCLEFCWGYWKMIVLTWAKLDILPCILCSLFLSRSCSSFGTPPVFFRSSSSAWLRSFSAASFNLSSVRFRTLKRSLRIKSLQCELLFLKLILCCVKIINWLCELIRDILILNFKLRNSLVETILFFQKADAIFFSSSFCFVQGDAELLSEFCNFRLESIFF